MKAATLDRTKFNDIDIRAIYKFKRYFSIIFEPVRAWNARALARTELNRLSNHLLQDINMDKARVKTERLKPCWLK